MAMDTADAEPWLGPAALKGAARTEAPPTAPPGPEANRKQAGPELASEAGEAFAGASAAMIHIAYFGHDAYNANVDRRARTLMEEGFKLTGFMMRRREASDTPWPNVDLGRTQDAAFLQRLGAIVSGARIAAADPRLAEADLVIARSLDMVLCAFLAKRHAKLETPVVYECLDVHRMLSRPGPLGIPLRAVERHFLKRCCALIVSSPGFVRNHFNVHHRGLFTPYLLENRLGDGQRQAPRPAPKAAQRTGALRLGWIGMLRCRRSFDLLMALADRFGDAIEIHLHGLPARTEIPDFDGPVAARANVTYHGRYKSPDDLPAIYHPLDLVWAGDFMEAGLNSVWLLPNRIYEGGYHGTPPIAPAGTETAAWIAEREVGILVDEPLEEALPARIAQLIRDRSEIARVEENLLALGDEVFVEPKGATAEIIEKIMAKLETRA